MDDLDLGIAETEQSIWRPDTKTADVMTSAFCVPDLCNLVHHSRRTLLSRRTCVESLHRRCYHHRGCT